MAISAFFFSVMSLLVKAAGQRLPTQEVVFARSLIVLLLSTVVVRRRGISHWGLRRDLLIIRGALGFGALLCFYHAVIHLPLAEVTVIQFTHPVFTALLAAAVLSERLHSRQIGLTLLSLAGVVMVARPAVLFGGIMPGLDPLMVGIALASSVLSAAAYVTVRKLGQSDDPMVIVFYFALIATLGSVPLVIPVFVMPTLPELVALLGVGVTTYTAQVAMTYGLKLERAGRATAVRYLQIVFAAIWGMLFFAEVPGLLSILGALLIIAGTLRLAR
jgi:drug/metabolite transporter (DMT)-like permease